MTKKELIILIEESKCELKHSEELITVLTIIPFLKARKVRETVRELEESIAKVDSILKKLSQE